jgi:hypothetical protein
MKVSEFIEALSRFDPGAEVIIDEPSAPIEYGMASPAGPIAVRFLNGAREVEAVNVEIVGIVTAERRNARRT